MKAGLLALGILLSAPYQCATEPNERPIEDSAPKALWMLAERFAQEHNEGARQTTLHQLIEQYPSSRYAARAQEALAGSSAKSDESRPAAASEDAGAP